MECLNFFPPLIQLMYPWMDIIYCSNKKGIIILLFIFTDMSTDWMGLQGNFLVTPLNFCQLCPHQIPNVTKPPSIKLLLISKMPLKIKTRNHVTCETMCYFRVLYFLVTSTSISHCPLSVPQWFFWLPRGSGQEGLHGCSKVEEK